MTISLVTKQTHMLINYEILPQGYYRHAFGFGRLVIVSDNFIGLRLSVGIIELHLPYRHDM